METTDLKSKIFHRIYDKEASKYDITKPYIDTTGHITVGVGYNLSDRGVPPCWDLIKQCKDDIDVHLNQLNKKFSWFNGLSDNRKIGLLDICYSSGFHGFCGFTDMIDYLSLGDYKNAANEILDTPWAKTVGHRAEEVYYLILNG